MTSKGRVVYMNGEFVAESEARISIYDSALMFGDMIFEMTRSFNGAQFKLRQHLERLYASAKVLRIAIPLSIDEMEGAVQETIEANRAAFRPDDEHRIMVDVSRGLLSIYEGIDGVHTGPNVIISDFPLRWTVAGMGRMYDSGIRAVVTSQRAIPAHLLDTKIKNRSRIHYLMANIEVANHAGEDNWALLLDPDGYIAEGSGDNFFIVNNGDIVSPEGRNILRGISRQYVLDELAPQIGAEACERNIDVYDVTNADEAFMTATPFCILPVTSINGVPIGDGRPGPVVQALLDAWSKNVGVDIVQQIKAWELDASPRDESKPSPYAFPKPE